MEQATNYEWRGDTQENEDFVEDFEDYKANGGELEYDEWLSEKIEQAELIIDNERETNDQV
jgi:hypothetical protein